MTQKELLYLEDGVSHERIIISFLKEANEYILDEELIEFFEKEIKKHTLLEEKLMKLLKEKSNE